MNLALLAVFKKCKLLYSSVHYIILNNGILKSNSSVFPWSEGYISQYTPQEALQDIVYIRLPPGINFGISLKRSEITQMGYCWSPLDS